MGKVRLSVVVPVLNETAGLSSLFATLAEQREVVFEVIFSDGGSSDGTVAAIENHAAKAPFPVKVVSGRSGRGGQLNHGAGASSAPYLLFLHADSRFADPLALRNGIDHLQKESALSGRIAGRFALSFGGGKDCRGYRYYELKARLGKPWCIHGDQGFLLGRDFFREAGMFPEELPFCEDTRLAEEVRCRGRWILLPAIIETSPRRFEVEGLKERQTLNAIILNLVALGEETLVARLSHFYRSQDRATRLLLPPLLEEVERLLAELPPKERFNLWYRTGRFVRDNAWQLAFAVDVRRAGSDADLLCPTPVLDFYQQFLDRLSDHPCGRIAAAFVTRFWLSMVKRGLL